LYKDYNALERVLDSVLKQSQIPNQIILAHDTIDATIQEVIDKFTPQLNITYINQEDTGFNKNRILNKAILESSNQKIIFIDGDCLLHPKFIEAHAKAITEGVFSAKRHLDLNSKSFKPI
jgi:glycosyltransferase involved in cell wall biosynthesis